VFTFGSLSREREQKIENLIARLAPRS